METKIIKMYNSGISMNEIISETNLPKHSILKIIKKNDCISKEERYKIHLEKYKNNFYRHPNRVSAEKEIEIVKTYKSTNKLILTSKLCKVSTSVVKRVLTINNIPVHKNNNGKHHHNWKGGINKNKGDGYIGIWNPKHERADGGGYVFEHTLNYEKHYGVLPKKGECIHHIDLDKHNNDIKNLFLCTHSQHLKIHRQLEKLIKPLMDSGIIIFENGAYKLK